MESSTTKENILRKIRKALAQPVPLPFPLQDSNAPIYAEPADDLSVLFAAEFTRLLGQFAYCINEEDLVQQISLLIREKNWKEIYCKEESLKDIFKKSGFDQFSSKMLGDSDVSITSCESLVARTGSIVLSAAITEGRTASVYAPIHICIARTSQLVYDVKDALQNMQHKYSNNIPSLISFATGPSRTADIEKTLVVGVHGPREVYCFLVEE
ncbi:MAG: LutC/YkgG family protein [Chitinophagaceae bacterium]